MKKILLLLLSLLMVFSVTGCNEKQEKEENQQETETTQEEETIHEVLPLYENSFVVQLFYDGLDMQGLEDMNLRYGSENYGDANVGGGCSITFATYYEGTVGAIRNMDLQSSKYCAYEMSVYEGENVKYPFWALAYTGMDEKSYYEVLQEGVSDDRYKQLPFTATDAMSFGYNDTGDRASLYCAILMRSQEQDDDGNYLYTCSGTNPGAKYRCATQSAAALIAANCITIDQALAFTGAVDEQYNRIYPFIEPSLDVYTFNIETETTSNHWFEVVAMEDSTGRHGVLEFIDNKAIW
ncbi:MAG: hypothetical protein Q4E99_05570, partial [Bacillota bacterium]|nr:hypothetical protein [Bacillota bacterium]